MDFASSIEKVTGNPLHPAVNGRVPALPPRRLKGLRADLDLLSPCLSARAAGSREPSRQYAASALQVQAR
jgi:hypothetical protein